MKLELVRTKNNKLFYILASVIFFCFVLSWILLVGLDKVEHVAYREYLHSTYTVFTQFGFLMFSFLVSHTITKDYNNRNILFYNLLGEDSLTYFLKKVAVLTIQSFCLITVCLVGVCVIFNDFSAFFQALYLYCIVMLQYILLISLITLYAKSSIISIGCTIAFWLGSIGLIMVGGVFSYVGFFDASNSFYASVTSYFKSFETFLPLIDNLYAALHVGIIFFIALIGAFMAKKVWLKHGS